MKHWTLVFRAEGDGPPVEIRVRKLLKAALRCYRLRCIQVRGDESPERAKLPKPYKTVHHKKDVNA